MGNKVDIEITLPLEDLDFLREVAKLADTDLNTVINVIISLELIKIRKAEKDGRSNKAKSKRGNAKSPKKSRMAKRTKS